MNKTAISSCYVTGEQGRASSTLADEVEGIPARCCSAWFPPALQRGELHHQLAIHICTMLMTKQGRSFVWAPECMSVSSIHKTPPHCRSLHKALLIWFYVNLVWRKDVNSAVGVIREENCTFFFYSLFFWPALVARRQTEGRKTCGKSIEVGSQNLGQPSHNPTIPGNAPIVKDF